MRLVMQDGMQVITFFEVNFGLKPYMDTPLDKDGKSGLGAPNIYSPVIAGGRTFL